MFALQAVFPALSLNPLGFRLQWESEERGKESVRYVLWQERPDIMRRYDRLVSLAEGTEAEIVRKGLRQDIEGIRSGHFNAWGLSGAIEGQFTPYFRGSYEYVLRQVFPALYDSLDASTPAPVSLSGGTTTTPAVKGASHAIRRRSWPVLPKSCARRK
jgi:hypothetical protein